MARPQDVRIRFVGKDQTKQAFRSVQNNTKKLLATGAALGSGFAAPFLALFTGASLISGIRTINQELDTLAKRSRETGFDPQAFQQFALAFELGGSSAQQFEKINRRLAQTLVQARDGLVTYTRIFDELNIDPFTVDIEGQEAALTKVAQAFAAVPDRAQAYGRFIELFGARNAAAFQTVLQLGEGVNTAAQRLNELGGELDTSVLQRAEDAQDTFTVLGQAFRNVFATDAVQFREFFGGIGTAILKGSKALTEWTTDVNASSNAIALQIPGVSTLVDLFNDLTGATERSNVALQTQTLDLIASQGALDQLAGSYIRAQRAAEAQGKSAQEEEGKRQETVLRGLQLARRVLLGEQTTGAQQVGRVVDSRRIGGPAAPTQDPQLKALNELIKDREGKQAVEALKVIVTQLEERTFKTAAS